MLIADTKYALRNLRRSPGFTAVAVLTLALGIGATTAIFSAVDALLLRSLPYPQAERLVMLWVDGTERGFARQDVTNPPTMYDWERELTGVERLAGYTGWRPTLTGQGDPQQVAGSIVTQGYFDTLGVQPALGRGFLPEEDVPEGPQRVVISHGLWQRLYGGAPDVLGKALDLNARSYEVIGVMPPGFVAPNLPEAEVWAARQAEREGGRGGFFMEVIARLKPGATVEQVDAELDTVMKGLGERFPQDLHQLSGFVQPLGEYAVEGVRTQLLVLLGATALVLLIACANLTNLLLARATGRGREFAVRAALGAGRARLARQMLNESAVLALLGALAGLAVAWIGVRWIEAALPGGLARTTTLALDLRVLGFAALAALGSALVFGSVPALVTARRDLVGALRDGDRASAGGRGGQRLRAGLVVLNFALAVALTVSAGLFLKSLLRLQAVDPGFRPAGVLSFTLTLPFVRYPERPQLNAAHDALLEALRAVPGASAVGFTSTLPFGRNNTDTGTAVEGIPLEGEPLRTWYSVATPGYLDALGVAFQRGRDFEAVDRGPDAPCRTVVTRTYVDRYMGGGDPLGRTVVLNPRDQALRCEVVGLVGDMRFFEMARPPDPTIYLPAGRFGLNRFFVVMRTEAEPLSLLPAARRAVATVDPLVAIADVQPMTTLVADSMRTPRLVATLTSVFAGLALLLAALGVYGVLAYSVTTRTREFGVRMALGARPRALLGEVLGSGLRLAAAGFALGAVLTFATGRLLGSLLYEVEAFDPMVFVLVSAVLVLVAAVATLVPAWRAARVDPMEALRHE